MRIVGGMKMHVLLEFEFVEFNEEMAQTMAKIAQTDASTTNRQGR